MFQVFFAGFETSSTILSAFMYYMAKNPEVQETLYQEIHDVFEANDNGQHVDYATVNGLKYLDMALHETLRMYPLINLERVCVKDFRVPGTSFTIPTGMLVQIPTAFIMSDARFYPEPAKFIPERFSPEAKAERSPYLFLAFGQGPRNCVGMRFALLQVKMAITRVVGNYKVLTSPKTPEQLIVDPKKSSTRPIGGFWLKLEKRNHN